MIEPNSHKYQLKQPLIRNRKLKVVNVSRSVGNSGHWIGCGSVDKSGVRKDHPKACFPFYSLVYVIKGNGEYIDEHHIKHSLTPGCFFQRRPGIVHSTLIDELSGWQEWYIDLDKEYFDHLCDIGLLEHDVPVYQIKHNPLIEMELKTLMQDLEQSTEKTLPDIVLKTIGIIRNLISQANISRYDSDTTAMVEKSCLVFNQSFSKRIDLKDYCRTNGWGYETFRKNFKSQLGVSPKQYLVRRRMDEACRLLRVTQMRMAEIADFLGYKSQYEFSTHFKRQFNVNPKHFRDGKMMGSPKQLKM